MNITHDPEPDTLPIRLGEVHISESDELQEGIIADFDHLGNMVGFEILEATKRITEPQNMSSESKGHPICGSPIAGGNIPKTD